MQIFTSPFGNLARFRLGTWQVFVWELGKKNLFQKLSSSVAFFSKNIANA